MTFWCNQYKFLNRNIILQIYLIRRIQFSRLCSKIIVIQTAAKRGKIEAAVGFVTSEFNKPAVFEI